MAAQLCSSQSMDRGEDHRQTGIGANPTSSCRRPCTPDPDSVTQMHEGSYETQSLAKVPLHKTEERRAAKAPPPASAKAPTPPPAKAPPPGTSKSHASALGRTTTPDGATVAEVLFKETVAAVLAQVSHVARRGFLWLAIGTSAMMVVLGLGLMAHVSCEVAQQAREPQGEGFAVGVERFQWRLLQRPTSAPKDRLARLLLLLAFRDVSKRNGLVYWLDGNTLRGSLQTGRILPYDHQGRVGIDGSDMIQWRGVDARDYLEPMGLKLYVKGSHFHGPTLDGNPSWLAATGQQQPAPISILHVRTNQSVDVRPASDITGGWRDRILPTENCTLEGEVFQCPHDAADYLEEILQMSATHREPAMVCQRFHKAASVMRDYGGHNADLAARALSHAWIGFKRTWLPKPPKETSLRDAPTLVDPSRQQLMRSELSSDAASADARPTHTLSTAASRLTRREQDWGFYTAEAAERTPQLGGDLEKSAVNSHGYQYPGATNSD